MARIDCVSAVRWENTIRSTGDGHRGAGDRRGLEGQGHPAHHRRPLPSLHLCMLKSVNQTSIINSQSLKGKGGWDKKIGLVERVRER